MWIQYYRLYNEEDDIMQYFQVRDNGTLVVSIDLRELEPCYSITNVPHPVKLLEEPIKVSEFRSHFKDAVKFFKSNFGLG
jgi:hypothetical protein